MTRGVVMSKSDDFWQYAEEAFRSVPEAESESRKQALIDLALTWTQAALKADASVSYNNPPKYSGR
jgi:hypothetical protein